MAILTGSGRGLGLAYARELAASAAVVVNDQKRIDTFADATDDHQSIHTDPERAKVGPFGTTTAHG